MPLGQSLCMGVIRRTHFRGTFKCRTKHTLQPDKCLEKEQMKSLGWLGSVGKTVSSCQPQAQISSPSSSPYWAFSWEEPRPPSLALTRPLALVTETSLFLSVTPPKSHARGLRPGRGQGLGSRGQGGWSWWAARWLGGGGSELPENLPF